MAIGRTIILTVAIALVVIVGGVSVYLMASGPEGTGTVRILVKDLPDDWIHVNVTFSEVKIHAADAGNNSGWRSLSIKNQTVDLASLTNVSELLASGNVSAGKYTQIRLVVTNVTGTMADGTVVNFTVPSGELKTNHPFNVTADHTETLTLDIDLSRSIAHNAQGWMFKPVLGSITEG
ncbi:MAG TPA: DUF4382 domain-containing protein [Thermoplasmata archaeon]